MLVSAGFSTRLHLLYTACRHCMIHDNIATLGHAWFSSLWLSLSDTTTVFRHHASSLVIKHRTREILSVSSCIHCIRFVATSAKFGIITGMGIIGATCKRHIYRSMPVLMPNAVLVETKKPITVYVYHIYPYMGQVLKVAQMFIKLNNPCLSDIGRKPCRQFNIY